MAVSKMALITFFEQGEPVDPGYGVSGPSYGGGHPSHGLPHPPHYPSHGLPGGGDITLLPVYPFDPTVPDNTLPGGGTPSNELPRPGKKYVVKWLACHGLILVPDNTLPETPTAEPK